MRTAALISGSPRWSADFDSQLEYLQNSEIDWYILLWANNSFYDPKIPSNWYDVRSVEDARSLVEPFFKDNHKIVHFEMLDPSPYMTPPRDYTPMNSNPFNVWQQYNILRECDLRRKQSGVIYDLVIRSRPDVGINKPIDLQWIHRDLRQRPNWIVTPDNYRYGYAPPGTGFCDQFAIGLPYAMSLYCEAVYWYDKLYQEGIYYNPECLIQTVLDRHGIEYPPTQFEITRGGHWVPIEHGRWGEIQVRRDW